jgi:heptosyltransferase-2
MENHKTVIRLPNHLGDIIMALPAIVAFARQAENHRISMLLPGWAVPLLSSLEDVDLLPIPNEKLHGPGAVPYQSRLLRQHRFDLGALLTPSFSSALIFSLGGVGHRYGYPGEGRGFLLNRPFRLLKDIGAHRSMKYAALLEYMARTTLPYEFPRIEITPGSAEKAAALLDEAGLKPGTEYAVISPRAVAASRRWGTHNYGALARRLIEEYDLKVALLGTWQERPAGEEVAGFHENIFNLCGLTDLDTAAAVMHGARLFVGNDSGLAHLAAAAGIPLVVLSGADNPEETSPLSRRKTVIVKDYLECIACVKNTCPLTGEAFMRCMKDITVGEVFNAAAGRLNK